MTDENQRALAETVFERERKLEKEISEALKIEAARHAAAVQNMRRLKALPLALEAKANSK